MADTIKGLEVKIGADTAEFIKELKKVDKSINATQRAATTLQKGLQLEFDDKRFTSAQRKVQQALDKSAEKAAAIRQQLQYLENTGKVDTEGYKKLADELVKAENQAILLQKQLKEIQQLKFDSLAKPFNQLGNALSTAGKKLAGLSVAAGGALAGMTALGKNAVSTADEIATLATQYGTSAEAIQKFGYIALQTDTDVDALYKGLIKIRAGLADLSTGATSTASQALQQLNVNFDKLDGTENQFYAIIEALADMEDKTQMVAIANDIFGDKLANSLLPLIYAGSDAIKEYASEFGELGALSDEQVEQLAKFDNVLNKLKTQFKNIALQIGSSFLPIMQTFATLVSEKLVPSLQRLANWFNNLTEKQQKLIVGILAFTAVLSPMLLLLGKISSSVGSLISLIPKLGTALNALAANPIVLAFTAIVALLAIMYARSEEFRESINELVGTLMDGLAPILDLVGNLLKDVFKLLMPIIDALGNMLVPIIQTINVVLQPVVTTLKVIFDLITGIIDGILWLFGKGWLWGKKKNSSSDSYTTATTTSTPSIDASKYAGSAASSSSVINNNSTSNSNDAYNIVINVNGGDYVNPNDLAEAISKKLALQVQARR